MPAIATNYESALVRKSDLLRTRADGEQRESAVPKEIGAAKFKAGCLKILDELGPEGVVITKNGKPVARLTPIKGKQSKWIGALKDKLVIKGDIFSTGLKWDAESGYPHRPVRSSRRANKS
jgi:prevent-host-death family protein